VLVEGEPGIGKTTLWLAAIERAQARGFRVLSARAAAAESVLAYSALADLLSGVDPTAWHDLPRPQHLALDRALLRTDEDGPATDQRVVAAASLSVINGLTNATPVPYIDS
jgi:MoxR-like ATPase